MSLQPSRGEIWLADLDPTLGHEQAGQRPVLVVSTNDFNHGYAELVIAVPLTSTARRLPLRVEISPPDGGVRTRCYALCDSVRSMSKERLKERWGTVSDEVLFEVEDALRVLMEL